MNAAEREREKTKHEKTYEEDCTLHNMDWLWACSTQIPWEFEETMQTLGPNATPPESQSEPQRSSTSMHAIN